MCVSRLWRAAVTTTPEQPVLDERGKCVFQVTFLLRDSTARVGDSRVLVVVKGGGGDGKPLVPVVSTPIHVVTGDVAVDGASEVEWMGVNCRLFPMPDDRPPIVLLECLGRTGSPCRADCLWIGHR